MTSDQKFKEAAEDTDEFITKMLYQYEADTISALLIIKGMGMYKSIFLDDEYQKICEKIYMDRNKVIPFL
ncbi:MAG: hypothetical protein EBU90_24755 [Proteobacteria bacterium]|nr:hypothetical protein [Pseudomonadota bacterium]